MLLQINITTFDINCGKLCSAHLIGLIFEGFSLVFFLLGIYLNDQQNQQVFIFQFTIIWHASFSLDVHTFCVFNLGHN